jgi:hypothetical protein
MKRLLVLLSCAGLAMPLVAQADPNIAEGNWDITTKMEMAGMPFAMPPMTQSRCVTKDDLVPDMSQGGQKCTVLDRQVSGDTVSWRTQCTGPQGKVDGRGQVKYSGKTYDGSMVAKMTEPGGGQAMDVKYNFQGKHTGPCKAEPGKK